MTNNRYEKPLRLRLPRCERPPAYRPPSKLDRQLKQQVLRELEDLYLDIGRIMKRRNTARKLE